MSDTSTENGKGDSVSTDSVATEEKSVSEEDEKKAEEYKETANEFFKSNKHVVFVY